MSLRPIDSQVSLSKAFEAGMLQNQLNHKPMHDQEANIAQTLRQAEIKRSRTGKSDKPEEALIRDGSESRGGHGGSGAKSDEENNEGESRKNDHPYKGKFIDLSM